MPAINNQQAEQELFRNYNNWKRANPAVNSSNSPDGCSQITVHTANYLKGKWASNSKPNSWNQSFNRSSYDAGGQIFRWVTRSLSKGPSVIDFHARWERFTFLRHFEIVP